MTTKSYKKRRSNLRVVKNEPHKTENNFIKIVVILSWLAIALIIFATNYAKAEDDKFLINSGLGVFSTEGHSISQVKMLEMGIQEDLWYTLKQRLNGGAWLDARGDGRHNSTFAGYQLGFEVTNDVVQASIFSGPTLISTPDSALGGPFQFNETIFFGIVDKQHDSIGITYNHFSSAGLEMPNQGKDFMGLGIKFPF